MPLLDSGRTRDPLMNGVEAFHAAELRYDDEWAGETGGRRVGREVAAARRQRPAPGAGMFTVGTPVESL